MKNTGTSLFICMVALIFVAVGCNMSTANLSGLTTSSDKDGKTPSSTFKTGETINAQAPVANNPGKVKVKFYMTAEDVKGMTKGESIKATEISVDIDGSRAALYTFTIGQGLPGGKYKLNAEMLNEAGEKKDSKSADITVTQIAPPAATTDESDDDK